MKFKLKIITFQGIFLEQEVEMIQIKTTEGELGILANHIPLISTVEISKLIIHTGKNKEEFAIAGGIVYVDKNLTTIVSPAVESKKNIDVARAKRKLEDIKNKIANDKDDKHLLALLSRSLNRINVAGK